MAEKSPAAGKIRFVCVGNPENRRFTLFADACRRFGAEPIGISYDAILAGKVDWERIFRNTASPAEPRDLVIFRFDSPGESFDIEKSLIAYGADLMTDWVQSLPPPRAAPATLAADLRFVHPHDRAALVPGVYTHDQAMGLQFDMGKILATRQWFFGFHRLVFELQHLVQHYRQQAGLPAGACGVPAPAPGTVGPLGLCVEPSCCIPGDRGSFSAGQPPPVWLFPGGDHILQPDVVRLRERLLAEAQGDLPNGGPRLMSPEGAAAFLVGQRVSDAPAACPAAYAETNVLPVRLMNQCYEIGIMFDKCATHAHLARFGVPQPRAIYGVRGYADLLERMREAALRRVFVKIAHGSSASGVVAFDLDPSPLAITSAELVRTRAGVALYNSLKIRHYSRPSEIATVINTLCAEKVTVEEWLEKATQRDIPFDLRIVLVRGVVLSFCLWHTSSLLCPSHCVVRMGTKCPMTNLHLGNERGDFAQFRAECPPDQWAAIEATCRRVGAAFPHTLYMGVDMLVGAGYASHAVLEVNAFGDLLPRIVDRWGLSTYEAEVCAAIAAFTSRDLRPDEAPAVAQLNAVALGDRHQPHQPQCHDQHQEPPREPSAGDIGLPPTEAADPALGPSGRS
ncbi:putative glutathione synthase [Paratrimastix pyriformis]|uniref:Glutathione synthase n=1 Tax=Paratrimastix pyriformis TaxID=342808 RepID=A0ABQ8UEV4_9EUKA|nr:putative glutathione synthase [Paratrimastix pyriformis]